MRVALEVKAKPPVFCDEPLTEEWELSTLASELAIWYVLLLCEKLGEREAEFTLVMDCAPSNDDNKSFSEVGW